MYANLCKLLRDSEVRLLQRREEAGRGLVWDRPLAATPDPFRRKHFRGVTATKQEPGRTRIQKVGGGRPIHLLPGFLTPGGADLAAPGRASSIMQPSLEGSLGF